MTSTQIRPTRRTLVRGAAWSVPVISIAAAAPAFAASPCDLQAYKLDWGTTSYTPPATSGGTRVGTASVLPSAGTGGSAVTVTLTSTVAGSMVRDSDNMQVSGETNVGGLNEGPGLNISHADPIPNGSGNRQDISISFSREVTNLQFTITDIDAQNGGWIDQIALTGTRTGARVSTVNGSGTTADPWMPTNYGNRANNSGLGNVGITYTASIPANTPIVLSFWNLSGNGNQRIFLSDFTFSAKGC